MLQPRQSPIALAQLVHIVFAIILGGFYGATFAAFHVDEEKGAQHPKLTADILWTVPAGGIVGLILALTSIVFARPQRLQATGRLKVPTDPGDAEGGAFPPAPPMEDEFAAPGGEASGGGAGGGAASGEASPADMRRRATPPHVPF